MKKKKININWISLFISKKLLHKYFLNTLKDTGNTIIHPKKMEKIEEIIKANDSSSDPFILFKEMIENETKCECTITLINSETFGSIYHSNTIHSYYLVECKK